MASNGHIPVCIGLIGFKAKDLRSSFDSFKASLVQVANDWNSLLSDHPDWPVKHGITMDFSEQDRPCEPRVYGFSVNVWRKKSTFERDYCSDGRVCASATWPSERLMIIGPSNRGIPADVFDYYALLHEYGHLLSLGDTYQVPGRTEWEGDQPPSVMNGNNHPREQLTTDDRWGLWAVFAAIKTGKRSCDVYGSDVPMSVNDYRYVMCDPRSVARYSHRSLADLPKLRVADRPDSPVANGIWKIGKWKTSQTALLVEPGNKSRMLRITSIHNGTIMSERGLVFDCRESSENQSDIRCASKMRDDLEIIFTSRVTGILYRDDLPDGISLKYQPEER